MHRQIVLLIEHFTRWAHEDQVVRDQFIQCFHVTGEHCQAQYLFVLPDFSFHLNLLSETS
ncbi:hypothetical protein BIY45_00350 [Stenotrophomonas sp. BIIR7]|nr:hypothetical protein BIY45_00350 [Stenotrophomonas sp. BIIR7]